MTLEKILRKIQQIHLINFAIFVFISHISFDHDVCFFTYELFSLIYTYALWYDINAKQTVCNIAYHVHTK